MIEVLIVDDSPVARELIRHILTTDPEISIVGTAANGEEGVRAAASLRPDVITMDIHMPRMDGYEATRLIMEQTPVPIVIVSASLSDEEVGGSFLALEAGAMALFERPVGITHPDFGNQARDMRQLVRAMAEVPVVRRWARPRAANGASPVRGARDRARNNGSAPAGVVCIGASTGGPIVIQTILRNLGKPFPLPVLIVQHIAAGFLDGFVDWMHTSTGFPIRQAENGQALELGVALIAPDGRCMELCESGRIRLVEGAHGCKLQPSVEHLFGSASDVYPGRCVGVLLSGMGKDGAAGLLRIRESGGKTIAQEETSCVVFGMPGEAKKLGAVEQFLPPEKIGHRVNELAAAIALK